MFDHFQPSITRTIEKSCLNRALRLRTVARLIAFESMTIEENSRSKFLFSFIEENSGSKFFCFFFHLPGCLMCLGLHYDRADVQPHALFPCGHRFCTTCCKGLRKVSEDYAFEKGIDRDLCPVCGKVVVRIDPPL